MASSPVTPAKGGGISLVDASSPSASAKKSDLTTSSAGTRSNHLDPSPASTYGESVDDDNVPATPLDVLKSAKRPQKYLAAIAETEAGGNDVPSSESPVYIVDRDNSFTSLIEKLGIVRISSDGTPLMVSPNKTSHVQPSSFVVQANGSTMEDPFVVSSDNPKMSPQGHETPTRKQRSATITPTPKGSSSCGSTRTPSAKRSAKTGNVLAASPFSPREDRMTESPSADNAQAIFPPDACVFVANLSSAHPDEQLERAVNEIFSQFGTVYTKIRRDIKGMPFAFCQYETKSEADCAIVEGKGKMILGRKCRTEIAKVQRALYVSRHNGESVKEDEVLDSLKSFGAIESIFAPSETEREVYHLPHGFWVRFAFFQDCRDAFTQLRDHPEFRYDQHQEPVRDRGSVGRQRVSPYRYIVPPNYYGYIPGQDMNPWIFVGNLPVSVTQDVLMTVFGIYGNIMSMQLVTRPSQNNDKTQIYAFIEYLIPGAARAAVANENNRLTIGGHKIRVEKRDTRAMQSPVRPGDQCTTLFDHHLAPHNRHLNFAPQPNMRPAINFQEAFAQIYPQAFGLAMSQQNSEMVANVARTLGGNQPQLVHAHSLYPAQQQYGYYPSGYGTAISNNTFVNAHPTQSLSARTPGYTSALSNNTHVDNHPQASVGYNMPQQYHGASSSFDLSSQHTAANNIPSPSMSSVASHQSGAPLHLAPHSYGYAQAPGYYMYSAQQGPSQPYAASHPASSAGSVDHGAQSTN